MKKFTAIEWQSFSLKKDIEVIVKKLQDNRTVQFSILSEIALVILGVALPNIFSELKCEQLFWVILSVFSIIPLIIILINWIIIKHKENGPGSDRMNSKDFIDAFDNAITYYIFISESYYTMLSDALSYNENPNNSKKIQNNIIHFYYIQASYYYRKAIEELAPIQKIIDNVLSYKIKEIEEKRLILLPRYYNARDLLYEIYKYINERKDVITSLDNSNLIIQLNDNYMKKLKIINNDIKDWYEENIKKDKSFKIK